MLKSKKIISLAVALVVCTTMGRATVFAAETEVNNYEASDPNKVISTLENVYIPNNVSLLSYEITYDHNSDINWNRGYRQVEGNTQAKQGSINISSYTRARFETLIGLAYCDSGRVWSETEGSRSYAESDWELYDSLNSGVAHTYYGIEN